MRAETHPVKIGILISNRCYGETRKQRGALSSPFESLPEVERDHYNGKLLLQSLGFEEIIELFDASHDQLTQTFNQLKSRDELSGELRPKTLICCIYSGHGVIRWDLQANIVTNSRSSDKVYFPIEKTLKTDIAKAFPNTFVLGILECSRALPPTSRGQAFQAQGEADDEEIAGAEKKHDLEIESGHGNYVLTFPTKSGKRKEENNNRLIPWYYQLMKKTFRLRKGDYMVLPIPRFIIQSPPLNNGEHVARGAERLRIYLPKDQELPAFVLRSISLTCPQLQEQILQRKMPQEEIDEYENWLIEHNSCSSVSSNSRDGDEFNGMKSSNLDTSNQDKISIKNQEPQEIAYEAANDGGGEATNRDNELLNQPVTSGQTARTAGEMDIPDENVAFTQRRLIRQDNDDDQVGQSRV